MNKSDILWDYEPGGNVEHIAAHDLTPDDVDHVLLHPTRRGVSRSSGRPMTAGRTPDGRYVVVFYDRQSDGSVYPVTAYEPD